MISCFFSDSSAPPAGFLLDDAHDFLFFRWFVRCIQKQVIRQLSEAAAENRGLNHDIKHHLRAIDRMASEHGQTEICDFLFQVEEQIAASLVYSHVAFCKNPVVNALDRILLRDRPDTGNRASGADRSARSDAAY